MGARKLSCQFIERRTSRKRSHFEQIGSVQRHDLFVRPFRSNPAEGTNSMGNLRVTGTAALAANNPALARKGGIEGLGAKDHLALGVVGVPVVSDLEPEGVQDATEDFLRVRRELRLTTIP